MSNKEEQKELVELISKFFKSEISTEYLQERLEAPSVTDGQLWEKLLALGFFEYFSELDRSSDPFSLLGEISRKAGTVPLPENLCECLLTGPLLLSVLASGHDLSKVQVLFGKESVLELLAGTKSLLAIPITEESSISVKKTGSNLLASGELYGVPLRPDSVGCVFVCGDKLYISKFADSLEGSSKELSASLDRLTPRGVFNISKLSTVQLESVLADEWLSLHRYIVASELVGMGERCIEMTSEYVKDRKQFGVSVGCFQAVRNPLAEAYLKAKELEAIYFFLGGMFERSDSQRDVVSMVFISAAISRVPAIIEKCLQLHGGIGFTWEYSLHLYLRRAKSYEALFGLSSKDGEQICSLSLEL